MDSETCISRDVYREEEVRIRAELRTYTWMESAESDQEEGASLVRHVEVYIQQKPVRVRW